MIGQPGRHRRRPLLPLALLVPLPQRPHRPAEVVAVHREVGHRLVHPPVLAEPVRLPRLPRVAVPVRPVLPLHERRVDRPAHRRRAQRRLPPPPRSRRPPRARPPPPGPSPAPSPPSRRSGPPAAAARAGSAGGPGRAGRLGASARRRPPRSPSRRPGTRRWSSARRRAPAGAVLDLGDDLLGVLDRAGARDDAPGPAGARGRRRRGPSSPPCGRRPGRSGRSSPASWRRTTTSRRTGPRGSEGEKATSSS